MRCAACGNELVAGERFCESCGKAVADHGEPSTGAAPATVAAIPDAIQPPTPRPPTSPRLGSQGTPGVWSSRGWLGIALLLYAVIADAGVETFLRGSPLRWWVLGGAAAYLLLCAAAWRLAPDMWLRLDWRRKAGLSLSVLVGAVALTAWQPAGMTDGIAILGLHTSTVLAAASGLVIALAGLLCARNRILPLAAKIVAGALTVYGVLAFGVAIRAGTPYPALFHGASQLSRLPTWLQGVPVGALFVIPIALVAELAARLSQKTDRGVLAKVAPLVIALVIAVAGLRSTGRDGDQNIQVADAADAGNANAASPSPSPDVTPADQQRYDRTSKQLSRVMAGVDVLTAKIDRSLFDVDTLAAKLGNDPTTLLHYVRDEIRYEPYPGVLRGALGTLVCRAGNALDRSLLLAALLQKSGKTVQIVGGTLTSQMAGTLVSRLFDPAKPIPDALPGFPALVPQLASAMGVDAPTWTQAAARDSTRDALGGATLATEVGDQSGFVSMLLTKSGIDPSALTPAPSVLAEAEDHYWVQYKGQDGGWVNLDPSFGDAEPGKSYATPTAAFAPDSVPEALYHHVRVTMTLRVAQVANGKDEASTDKVLLTQEFRVADQQGQDIIVANNPTPNPELTTPGTTIADALGAVKSFQAVLQASTASAAGLNFDLDGNVSATPTGAPEAVDEQEANGIASGNNGLLGGANGALGGGPPPTTSRIVGEWVDYVLTSPGAHGQPTVTHRYRRDIVAPTTVQSWSAENPVKSRVAAASVSKDALREQLTWSEEILPVTGASIPTYAGYLAIQWLSTNRALLDYNMKRASGIPADEPSIGTPPTPVVGSLVLASDALEPKGIGQAARLTAVRSYFGGPGLIGYETHVVPSAKGPVVRQGFDIIAYAPRLVGNPSAASSEARAQAATLHVRTGVLATALESALLNVPAASALPVSRLSSTSTLTAARKQRVPFVVLRPASGGVTAIAALSVPDSIKAELASDVAAGQTLVVPAHFIALNGDDHLAWWRFDERSGELIGVMPGERGQEMVEHVTWQELTIDFLKGFNTTLCWGKATVLEPNVGDVAMCSMSTIFEIGALDDELLEAMSIMTEITHGAMDVKRM